MKLCSEVLNGVDIVFKIAGIGVLVAVACQLLKQAGRDDIALLTSLAGLVIVLSMVIGLIASLFTGIKGTFELY
ncbi:MAG: stage III sporulation protein AC [Clostridia bacterium]|nr:stage III sporulation protein AC [Clostridia bacterium]